MRIVVLILVLIVIIINSVTLIPEETIRIVQRNGNFKKIWKQGIHFKVPFIDTLSPVISKKEQMIDISLPSVITIDGVNVKINNTVTFQIVDAQKYYNEMSSFKEKLINDDKKMIKSIINDRTLEEVLCQKQEISSEVKKRLHRITTSSGVNITSVSITEIDLPNNLKNPINRLINLLQWKINKMESEF